MTLHELNSADEVNTFNTNNTQTIICFSATWCGPCKASKPQLEQLASTLPQSKGVTVGIVYEHTLGEDIQKFNIRAFPTYVLFHGMEEVGRVEGADFEGIAQMLESVAAPFGGSEGQSLGGNGTSGGGGGGNASSAAVSPEEARAQRLARFNLPAVTPAVETEKEKEKDVDMTEGEPKEEDKDVDMKTDEAQDKDTSTATETETAPKEEDETTPKENDGDVDMKADPEPEEMVDPTEGLSQEHLDTLTGSMGFTLLRAQKGLLNGGDNVEGAVEWLMTHQDDLDIDEPIALIPKSQIKKPLTAEEKLAKVEEIKALLKERRDERENAEKVEDVDREKQRRFMGKEMLKTKEEMDRDARKRETRLRKKEKDDQKRERARIRAEIEKDKAERRAHKGKLTSKLGVDGYHPDGIQYDHSVDADAPKVPAAKKPKASVGKIDEYIVKVSSYRAGGDGGKCLKILLAYVKNVVDKPAEDKFKKIKTDNNAYRTKVKPFLGAKNLLMAVGFVPDDSGEFLVLKEDADRDVLADTRVKLEAAYSSY